MFVQMQLPKVHSDLPTTLSKSGAQESAFSGNSGGSYTHSPRGSASLSASLHLAQARLILHLCKL